MENAEGRKTLPADSVIIAWGRQPRVECYEALKGKVKEIYKIGDCKEVRSVEWAIAEAANVSRQI